MDTLNSITNVDETEGSKDIIEIEIPYPLFHYLSSDDCNLQNICRICLSVNEQVLCPLFSSNDDSVLANMFMAISEVKMSFKDGLPSHICRKCHTEVINYYEFKMKCVKSDYTLKSVLKGEFGTKEESNKLIYDNLETKEEAEEEKINSLKSNTELIIKPEIKEETEIIDFNSFLKHSIGNDKALPILQDRCDNEKTVTNIDKDFNSLEDLKDSISDDEALCIVQDRCNNEKKITIIDKDPNSSLKEIVLKKDTEKSSSNKTKHHCTYCSKKFHKVKSLRSHMNRRHKLPPVENPHPCGQCKEVFNSEFDLNLHGMLHNQDNNWKCTECQKQYNCRQSLRRHIQRHMQSKRFPCEVCGKSFVEFYALRRHLRVHTGERPEKKHACTLCDKRFPEACLLTAHMAAHSGVRAHACACGAAFPSARLLASHRRVHSADKPYACLHCGKRFRHESTRNTHHRTHTGERPYVCAQCGKAFIQKSNMTLHMRTHTGERPYACTICDSTFSSSSTLKAHKRTHTGERPYSCKVCGKSFARVNLTLHMRLHTGERPHACPACHKRFTNPTRLREHYRLHTGEKPFECAACTHKFTSKQQLIRHVKKHEMKKRAGKKGVVMLPVTVTDKKIQPSQPTQAENEPDQLMLVDLNAPGINPPNLCTVHETPYLPQLCESNGELKTQVILLNNDENIVTDGVSYVNDVNYTNDVNLVTVNEGEVSISAASATMEGATVKLYQYDQSLLQIHTGSGQLTISRISSKMTANF